MKNLYQYCQSFFESEMCEGWWWWEKMGTMQIWSFRDLPSLSGVSNPAFDSIFLLKHKTKSNMFKYQIESKIKEVQTMTDQSKSSIPILCSRKH